MTSRKAMQIFVENIEDDILFLTFYCFSWWISIFEVNISHPIIVFTFCYINVDSEGLKFSRNKHSNVFYSFTISNIGGKCFLSFY